VDGENKIRGISPLDVLRPFLFEEGLNHVAVAGDLLQKAELVLRPADNLEDARRALLLDNHDELPVVDPYTNEVVGILREHDLHAAYNRALEYVR
jgi:CBS domain-containing protein